MSYRVQIDDVVRDASPQESAAIDAQNAEAAAKAEQKQLAEAAKISAQAKLKTLGLTDAEIAALVG
jgi:hypothetical protein